MSNYSDVHFVNGWRRDFVSMRVALHSLHRRYKECRTNKDKLDWEARCVERALAELMQPEPEHEQQKRGPKGGRAPCL